jgi:hypothetical protein
MKGSKMNHKFLVLMLISPLLLSALGGCTTSRLKASVAPGYLDGGTQVSKLGMAGPGASVAVSSFQAVGYRVIDMGDGTSADLMSQARERNVPFLAHVAPVGTDGAWWDGQFDFSMRISDTRTEEIVWSAHAEYGNMAIIDQTYAAKRAMDDMAEDFKKYFPPSPLISPSTPKEQHPRESGGAVGWWGDR